MIKIGKILFFSQKIVNKIMKKVNNINDDIYII